MKLKGDSNYPHIMKVTHFDDNLPYTLSESPKSGGKQTLNSKKRGLIASMDSMKSRAEDNFPYSRPHSK